MNYEILKQLNENMEHNSLDYVREQLSDNDFVEWEDCPFFPKTNMETWTVPEVISNYFQMKELIISKGGGSLSFKMVGYQKEPNHFIQVIVSF